MDALSIFVGAFLVFQIQPLMAKFILPWFGGSQSVWTTCLLFFQVALLGGYAYAHILAGVRSPRIQAAIHTTLLLAGLTLLPITPGAEWAPRPTDDPTARILLLLARCVGLPYLALAATSPLIQRWHGLSRPGASPYRLYALSNLGSLLGLLTFPFVVEPALSRGAAAALWTVCFAGFVILNVLRAATLWRSPPVEVSPETEATGPRSPGLLTRALWLALPASGSILLLATTNTLCQDIAAIPFLWVLPLSLYLVTFILAFERPAWYRRVVFVTLLPLLFAGLAWVLWRSNRIPLGQQAAVILGSLFAACMVCHGEVSRLRPTPRLLTSFYLHIAGGGALGGLFVGVLAPILFDSYAELIWGIGLLAGLVTLLLARERRRWLWPLSGLLGLAIVAALVAQNRREAGDTLYTSRSFYGVLKVVERGKGTEIHSIRLRHGAINHGQQFVDPKKARIPTTYYHEQGGGGLAMLHLERPGGRKVGLVGLGTGTLATYGRPGDTLRFYEIDPDIIRLAETRFSFLRSSPATVQIVQGDARLALEREAQNGFDLLLIDAFSGDAIPVHLLTREACAIYLRHLKQDGVIAIHISNRHLNLMPVVQGLAREFNLAITCVDWKKDPVPPWLQKTKWVLLSRDRVFLDSEPIRTVAEKRLPSVPAPILWTDDYTSVFAILRR